MIMAITDGVVIRYPNGASNLIAQFYYFVMLLNGISRSQLFGKANRGLVS